MTSTTDLKQACVSIVMPVHNQERYIAEAIASVIAQTYVSWQLLIVDDGSTDATCDVVTGFSDARITLLRQQKSGVCAARNKGTNASTGEYIAYLDADDVYLPNTLMNMVDCLNNRPEVGLCYGGYVRIDENNKLLSSYFPPPAADAVALLTAYPVTISCTLLRRTIHNQTDGFNPNYIINEDRDYFVRLALAGCTIRRADNASILRRVYENRIETSLAKKLTDQQTILATHTTHPLIAKKFRPLRPLTQRTFYIEWAYQSSLSGDNENLHKCLAAAREHGVLSSAANINTAIGQLAEAATRTPGNAPKRLQAFVTKLPPEWQRLKNQGSRLLASALLLQSVRTAVWSQNVSIDTENRIVDGLRQADTLSPDSAEFSLGLLKWDLDCSRASLGFHQTHAALRRLARLQGIAPVQQNLFRQLLNNLSSSPPSTLGRLVTAGRNKLQWLLLSNAQRHPTSNTATLPAPTDHMTKAADADADADAPKLLSTVQTDQVDRLLQQTLAVAELAKEFRNLRYTIALLGDSAKAVAPLRAVEDQPWLTLLANPNPEQLDHARQTATLFLATEQNPPGRSSSRGQPEPDRFQNSQILAAQTCGLGVVATQADGTNNIQHNLTGLLVSKRSAIDWQDSLRPILNDPQLGKRLGAMAQAQLRLRQTK